MIKIGVSACFLYPDPNRAVFGHKQLTYLEHDMSQYLSRKGVMPILLPDLPWSELEQFLKEMDGFVFQGGADIAPSSYGDLPIENGRWPGDPHRDQYELKIMAWAFERRKPIFGICRGFQLLNVFFGGKLYQDLALETGTTTEHRSAERYDRVHHEVDCTEGSLIERIYGEKRITVNSVHHQGIKRIGQNLVIDARSSSDQIVEAFHHEDLETNLVMGVQWHPEFSHTLKNTVADPKPLLDFFLERLK
jgi:putative glutamine amidotransferase